MKKRIVIFLCILTIIFSMLACTGGDNCFYNDAGKWVCIAENVGTTYTP